MAYLTFNNINNLNIYNESFATMGRQFVDGFSQLFDPDSWTNTRKADEKYLNNKRQYFDSMYEISGTLKNKLIGWIKKIPNVFYLPEEEMKQFLNTIDQYQDTAVSDGSGGSYTVNQSKALSLQRKARVSNNKNSFTNATCIYPFKIDKKVCILFFTFDSSSIYTAQVVTTNKYAKGITTSNFDITEIEEWEHTTPHEYIK